MKKLEDMTPMELGLMAGRTCGSRSRVYYKEAIRRCFIPEKIVTTNKIKDKKAHVATCVLSYMTKFQLATHDEELFNWMEELRQHIVEFKDGKTSDKTTIQVTFAKE